MGWDGAGNYNRQRNFSADASAGIKILASAMDQEINDIASAFTLCWARDGQNTPTADIPLGGNRLINGGQPQSATDYIRVKEVVENTAIYVVDTATSADRISASATFFSDVSVNAAPADGSEAIVKAISHKSSPVFYVNGHSANVIYEDGTRAVHAIISGGIYSLIYSSSDSSWVVQNPSIGVTSAESAAGAVVVNYKYDEGYVPRYGAVGTSALNVAINVNSNGGPPVEVVGGTYNQVDVSVGSVELNIHRDAIFKVPDNAITLANTSGSAALHITGNNVTINGHVFCDGNKANQNTGNFPADDRSGTFKVAGNDFTLNGTLEIVNAFWDGFTIDGGDTSGQEALRTIIPRIKVKDPANRSGTFWGAIGFNVDTIEVDSETAASGDHRIRIGTNSLATSESKGRISHIYAPGQYVIIEKNTNLLTIDSVQAASLKSEAATNIQCGRADLRNLDDGANLSFGVIGGSSVFWDHINVTNHNGTSAAAVSFEQDFKNVTVGAIHVIDSSSSAVGLRVRAGVGLHIGICVARGNAGTGIHVDESSAWTQSDFRFDYIEASGNGVTDVNFEDGIPRASYGYLSRTSTASYAGIAAAAADINVFPSADASPSVFGGTHFRTADGTTITDLIDGIAGQEIVIHVDHTVTFDVTGTNLTGNAGVDIPASAGDVIKAYTQNGTTWVLQHLDAA